MNEEKIPEVANLLHSLLIAYQVTLRDILSSGRAIFVCPVLDNFTKISKATAVHVAKSQSLDASLENLSKAIKASGLVDNFHYEKLSLQEYVVHVEGCTWAPEAHKKLDTKDLTCPFALMAMSIVQSHSGKRIKDAASKYYAKGTKTRIETINP